MGERRLGEDRLPDQSGQEDREFRHHIWHRVAQDDPRTAKPAGAVGADIS
jgi:hypothetical protein